MAPLGYIEVVDARGRVGARFAVNSWPATIGRAYTNSVILDDPFVSPEHLSIALDESGRLFARDLDSVNGLRDAPGGKRVKTLEIVPAVPFQIGHTLLRYCDAQYPVAATVVEQSGWRALPSWGIGLGSLGLVLGVLLLENYFESYERYYLARSVTESLTTLTMVFTWAAMWSVLSRIIVGRFHYAEHFALACAAIVISMAFGATAEWVEFIRPALPALWVASVVGSGILLGGLVFGHLAWASAMTRQSRFWAGIGVSAAIIATGAVADYAGRHAFTTAMEYSGVIKPLNSNWLPAISIDAFVRDGQKLKGDLGALAQKAKQP
jgi:FHA domain